MMIPNLSPTRALNRDLGGDINVNAPSLDARALDTSGVDPCALPAHDLASSRTVSQERQLRDRLTTVARSFEGKLYFAGAATVSVADDNRDGEPDYLPARTYERTSSFLFGIFGRESNTDDFALWIRGEGPKPGAQGKMNCWEAILLLAHEAGLLSEERLVALYQDAARVGRATQSQAAYFQALGNALGLDRAVSTRTPQPGDVVFFQSDLGYQGMEHVALALGTVDAQGRHEVMSLWQLPVGVFGFNSTLQKTTIEEIIGQAERYGQLKLQTKIAPMPFAPQRSPVARGLDPRDRGALCGIDLPHRPLAGVAVRSSATSPPLSHHP